MTFLDRENGKLIQRAIEINDSIAHYEKLRKHPRDYDDVIDSECMLDSLESELQRVQEEIADIQRIQQESFYRRDN